MKKAFDSVSHSYLQQMLQRINLHPSVYNWLVSYLHNRTQRTKANGEVSDYMCLDYSVPQGSILGPILFIFFINSLPNVLQKAKVKIYADDVVVYVSHVDPKVAKSTLQEELHRVDKLCSTVGLTINTNKTKWLWYGSAQKLKKCPKASIKIGGKTIKRVDCYRYLGANIDSTLSMQNHARMIHGKVNTMAFKLSKLRHKMDVDTAITIYKQVILPKFDYCSFLIDTTTKYLRKRLETLQNRILRICLRVKKEDESPDDLRTLCEVPLLETRRKELLTTMMFSKSKSLPTPPLNQPLRTRGDRKIKFPRKPPKNLSYRKTPYYRGVNYWNELDVTLQTLVSKEQFKTAIKKRLGTNLNGQRKKLIQARRPRVGLPP